MLAARDELHLLVGKLKALFLDKRQRLIHGLASFCLRNLLRAQVFKFHM